MTKVIANIHALVNDMRGLNLSHRIPATMLFVAKESKKAKMPIAAD